MLSLPDGPEGARRKVNSQQCVQLLFPKIKGEYTIERVFTVPLMGCLEFWVNKDSEASSEIKEKNDQRRQLIRGHLPGHFFPPSFSFIFSLRTFVHSSSLSLKLGRSKDSLVHLSHSSQLFIVGKISLKDYRKLESKIMKTVQNSSRNNKQKNLSQNVITTLDLRSSLKLR